MAKANKPIRGAPLPLFAQGEDAPSASAYVRANAPRLQRWAERGIFFGSSSWKYPGWKGIVYNRHYPSQRAFEQTCIAEYATVFPTVCADFALYDFPGARLLQAIYEATPEEFTVSFKVTDRITVKRYPKLPRYGANAGQDNPDFLNVTLFEDAFLRPLETLKHKRGAVIFEFSTFSPATGITAPVFLDVLGKFLAGLPRGFAFCVEIRNQEFLTAEYLAMLASYGVAHVLNNWTRMPPVLEQIRMRNVLPASFTVVRALLKPGRTYQEAVERFQPYESVKEENPELRLGLAETVTRCVAEGKKAYVYVNNRAEGNSPKTIEAILDILDSYPDEKL